MIKWFEGNPLALVLASICGVLLFTALILGVIWSLPPTVSDVDPGNNDAELMVDVSELDANEPIETYAVITERPVFNEDRLPYIEDDSTDLNEEDLAVVEVDAPEFDLLGVIITPSIRMVTLKAKDQPESLVAFEGQPLEGNYGTWQVSRIEARQITLASGVGEEVQLKLLVHDAAIKAPKKPVAAKKAAAEPDEQAKATDSDQPLSRAEEIRQRIAERREELRRAAEDKGEDEIDSAQQRKELQSMLTGVRRKESRDEN